ncbi:hydroxymethylbilane synthase [Erythrobacteraceae bacterium CFH 75059]|nr:hydroxymethylbilane synthase [Erythrobacteraceae bacterium CFH 75059]
MTDIAPPALPLRLGTRRSPLAMAQAEEARARLCAAHGWPRDAVELVPVTAAGDRIQDRPLAEIGGKALWTRELDACLLDGRIDAAVHSMKDVETVRPAGLTVGALLPRADRRDVLVGARSIAALPAGARVGTSAPRRAAQLLHLRPDLAIVLFRGNVATRLAKLAAGEADATLLARAGLERLDETGVGTLLDETEFLPAPAQGAIGIECRAGDEALRRALAAIDDASTRAEIEAERALLARLDGSCRSPVALVCRMAEPRTLRLTVALFSPDGADRVDGTAEGPAGRDDWIAAQADDLLRRAPPAVRAVFGGP